MFLLYISLGSILYLSIHNAVLMLWLGLGTKKKHLVMVKKTLCFVLKYLFQSPGAHLRGLLPQTRRQRPNFQRRDFCLYMAWLPVSDIWF